MLALGLVAALGELHMCHENIPVPRSHDGTLQVTSCGIQNARLDVLEVDAHASDLDLEVAGKTSGEHQGAVFAEVAHVPGAIGDAVAVAQVDELGVAEPFVVEISPGHAGAADDDLAGDALGNNVQVVVDDGHGVVGQRVSDWDVTGFVVVVGNVGHLYLGACHRLGRTVRVEQADRELESGEALTQGMRQHFTSSKGKGPFGCFRQVVAVRHPAVVFCRRGASVGDLLGGDDACDRHGVHAVFPRSDIQRTSVHQANHHLIEREVKRVCTLLEYAFGSQTVSCCKSFDGVAQCRVR